MSDLTLLTNKLFEWLSGLANLITSNWLLLTSFAIYLLRKFMWVFYKIKRKGGL